MANLIFHLILCLINCFVILSTKTNNKIYMFIHGICLAFQTFLFIMSPTLWYVVVFQAITFTITIVHYIKTK